jgi:hypothetical protein
MNKACPRPDPLPGLPRAAGALFSDVNFPKLDIVTKTNSAASRRDFEEIPGKTSSMKVSMHRSADRLCSFVSGAAR